ncbi:MAG: hypothetical protein IJU37_06565 [Desulfovibrio sp.]|nr:hypothetical protein [Desulfovibrio sp.]
MINAIQNTGMDPRIFQDMTTVQQARQAHVPQTTDTVSLHGASLSADEEADQAMRGVMNAMSTDAQEALSVHGNLDYNRIMQLLADVDV